MFQELAAEFSIAASIPLPVLLARMLGALALCGAIGFERETERHPAGLRTHMLVGLAAATYCILMLELVHQMADQGDHIRMDPVRILEAVTSGVAFLAAGMIVFSQGHVKGLTTGASMWLSASIGVACGLGLWLIAGMTTVLALIVVRIVKRVEKRISDGRHREEES